MGLNRSTMCSSRSTSSIHTEKEGLVPENEPPDSGPPKGGPNLSGVKQNDRKRYLEIKLSEMHAGAHLLRTITCIH